MKLSTFTIGIILSLITAQVTFGQVCTPGANGYQLIDFDGLTRGEKITNQFPGVTMSTSSGSGHLVAFETAQPTQTAHPNDNSNGDTDLGSPNQGCSPAGPGVGAGGAPGASGENCTYLGKVLIIEEHWFDDNGDGYDDYPDDLGNGGQIVMTFDEPTTVGKIEFLDDVNVTVNIDYFGGGTGSFNYVGPGENSFGSWDINADPNNDARNIQTLTFNLASSGGIVSLETCTDFASVGDFVWHDQNGNGIQDSGEPGIGGVTVYLLDENGMRIDNTTTASDGSYAFEDINTGTYSIEFTLPSGYDSVTEKGVGNDGTKDSDANTATLKSDPFILEKLDYNRDIDAGFYNDASLGDYVWIDTDGDGVQDGTESGLNGVVVRLYEDFDGDGVADGASIANTTTVTNGGNDGYYGFTGLQPEGYIVEFVEPAGYEFSAIDQGGNDVTDSDANTSTGRTGTIELESGENETSVDAGVYQTASIGDYVWIDTDGDGVQDGTESGLNGVVVRLYEDFDGDGVADGASIANTTTVTNGGNDGYYGFTGLQPEGYIVEFVEPAGYDFSAADQGGNDATDSDANTSTGRTETIELESGENDISVDAGVYQTASIGDYVWIDTDGDGEQDGTESGLNGVMVRLYEDFDGDGVADGPAVENTTTVTNGGNDGYYEFTGLQPEGYIVEFVEPAGYDFSAADQGGNDATDSDANTSTGRTGTIELESGENETSVDAGVYQTASIGNYIFEDMNGDNVYNTGDLSAEGITVNLYEDFDNDGTPDGMAIRSMSTGSDGVYLFDNLRPGGYIVEVTDLPGGYNFVTQNSGGDETIDSDVNESNGLSANYVLQSGDNYMDLDAGIVNSLLPVELISFKGQLQNQVVALEWATGSEINNDYFDIQRSANGLDFISIGKIMGSGNTNEVHTYTLKDMNPLQGINYYRLKQVDYDGQHNYSNIIAIRSDLNTTWNVFPNPTTDYLQLNTNIEDIKRIEIYGIDGKLMKVMPLENRFGGQQITIDMHTLVAGTYIVKIQGDQFQKSELVIKK